MYLEQNRMVQTYLDAVCRQIKWREVHGQVKDELLSHFEELVSELIDDGLTKPEAVKTALNRMGDATYLGRQLHQTHIPQKNWPLAAIVALLSGLGLVLMHILGNSAPELEAAHVFTKSLLYIGIGTAVLLGLSYFDVRALRHHGSYLYLGTMLLWLLALFTGQSIEGQPFLVLGPVAVNYTGIAPYFLVVALAGIFTNKDWTNRIWRLQSAILFVGPVIFGIMSNSASFIVMYTFIFTVLMIMSGAKISQLVFSVFIPIGLCFFIAEKIFDKFLNTHLQFIDQWERITPAAGMITAVHTDFVFLYSIKTFGWLAGVVIVALAAFLLLKLIFAARQIKDRFGSMAVGGLTACFAIQIIWHVLMSLGFAPISGFGFPFVSFGGSQVIIHLASIGLILSFYKRKNLRSLSD